MTVTHKWVPTQCLVRDMIPWGVRIEPEHSDSKWIGSWWHDAYTQHESVLSSTVLWMYTHLLGHIDTFAWAFVCSCGALINPFWFCPDQALAQRLKPWLQMSANSTLPESMALLFSRAKTERDTQGQPRGQNAALGSIQITVIIVDVVCPGSYHSSSRWYIDIMLQGGPWGFTHSIMPLALMELWNVCHEDL